MVDSLTGQSGLQTSSLLGQGHIDDLENNTARRRHVTGEGHNGDTLTSAIGMAPTGNRKILLWLLQVLLLVHCFDVVGLTSRLTSGPDLQNNFEIFLRSA